MKWIAAVIVAVGLYVAYPYWALRELALGIEGKDPVALETVVDWPALRASLLADIKAQMLMAGVNKVDGSSATAIGSMAGTLLSGAFVDRIVEAAVTPQGFLKLIEERSSDERFIDKVSYAFFSTPTVFRLDLRAENRDNAPTLTLLWSLSGGSWKVTRAIVPWDTLKNANTTANTRVLERLKAQAPAAR